MVRWLQQCLVFAQTVLPNTKVDPGAARVHGLVQFDESRQRAMASGTPHASQMNELWSARSVCTRGVKSRVAGSMCCFRSSRVLRWVGSHLVNTLVTRHCFARAASLCRNPLHYACLACVAREGCMTRSINEDKSTPHFHTLSTLCGCTVRTLQWVYL